MPQNSSPSALSATLVLGGARSGKSRFAESLARDSGLPRVYLATATAGDAEMQARIAHHRARRGDGWRTVEEPLALVDTLAREAGADRVVLVDCLTLWLSNLMHAGRDVEAETGALADWLRAARHPVVLVSNEVGLGLVPETPLGRAFRDAQGRLNQSIAAAVPEVAFIAAGLPLWLKRNASERQDAEGHRVLTLDSRFTPALMVQATGSNAGKSTLVAGLARVLARRGLRVAPFKPQNMSNNAAIAVDGGEIGRAQAVQARAARLPPSVHMNPVLLKPETDTGAQVIVHGRRMGTLRAKNFLDRKAELLPLVLESFAHLSRNADIVLVEGAGSPAEINLRRGDIANMGFAVAADVPVVLAGDIDRGGVIASLVGTHAVLDADERARIAGFLINKFRGEVKLFDDGLAAVTRMTGWPSLGVVPWLPQAAWLPAEDALDLEHAARTEGMCVIAVPMLARIANFDDLDPLAMEPGVAVRFVRPGQPIPAEARVIILPGSKSTLDDLAFLRAQGWDIDIAAHVRRGGHVLGLCGGYQMLGKTIADPDGVDGAPGCVAGLGLLDIETVMQGDKSTTLTRGVHCASGLSVDGYEIHLGRSFGPDCARPMLHIDDRHDGATSRDGRVQGTYLHGLFSNDAFRAAWLDGLGAASALAYETRVEAALDALADHLEKHLDIEGLLTIARRRGVM